MKDWSVFLERMDSKFPDEQSRIMCTSAYIHQGKVIIGLLKYCLDHRKFKGTLFSIERPYNYIENAINKHGISGDGLKFLGAVQKISSESLPEGKKVDLLDDPFCSTLLSEAMDKLTKDIDSSHIDFIIIDNFRALTHYVKLDCLYDFILPLIKKVEGKATPKIFVLIDHEKVPELPKSCASLCQCHIDITNDWFD